MPRTPALFLLASLLAAGATRCSAADRVVFLRPRPKSKTACLPPVAFADILSYARHMELLAHDGQLPLTLPQRTELDSRLATLDRDRRQGITWAALKAELEQRCP
jgi:putative addiction module component (TIGR02574 family)